MVVPNIYLLSEFSAKEPVIKSVYKLKKLEIDIIYLEKQTELKPFKLYAQTDIWCVVEGRCSALVNGKQKRIKDGDILITYPGRLHGIRNNSKQRVIVLSFRLFGT